MDAQCDSRGRAGGYRKHSDLAARALLAPGISILEERRLATELDASKQESFRHKGCQDNLHLAIPSFGSRM